MKKNAIAIVACLSFLFIHSAGCAQEGSASSVMDKKSTTNVADPSYTTANQQVTSLDALSSDPTGQGAIDPWGMTKAPYAKTTGSMIKMRGEYGASMGFKMDEFLWKDANANWQEKNWRYAFGDLNVNTYDPRIFDRYRLELETDTKTPWNAYCDIIMDPWSFVQVGHETVTNGWNDSVEINYKLWQNTGYTINETYRTYLGNSISTPELKVIGNQVTAFTATPALWGEPALNLSPGRTVKLDYLFRPVRRLWVEYKQEPFYLKAFPIADQAEALTSDDPFQLSNHHMYWAPSPWLWRFDPGMQLAVGQQEAQWNWDEQWYAQDSNRRFLTFLRGMSAGWNVEDFASLNVTAAAPMGLWDYYETVTSVPIAARFKIKPIEKWTIGSTYTSKYGIEKQQMKAQNHVLSFDTTYAIGEKTDVFGQIAASTYQVRQQNEETLRDLGGAYKIGMRSKIDFSSDSCLKCDTSFAYMSQKFAPGLADYRDTRLDRDWGQHIWFEPISSEDEATRIGDSIDVNRYVVGANARLQLMDNLLDVYLNFRNAHDAYTNKFIENILRAEAVYSPVKSVQFKGLALYRKYHDTIGDFDPVLRDRYTDELFRNYIIQDGEDADLATLSGGVKLDIIPDKVSVYGIYEVTNDPQYFPRGVLNNTAFNTLTTVDNIVFNRLVTQVYDQDLFSLPPYNFYDIIKACVTYRPTKDVQIKYTHVTNGNPNYAPLFDNNHTHDQIEVTCIPMKNVTFITGYSLSRLADLAREVDTEGGDPSGSTVDRTIDYHHNVYAQVNYNMKKDQRLTVQFGEMWLQEAPGSVFGPAWVSTNTSVLDTRAILRVWYQGKF